MSMAVPVENLKGLVGTDLSGEDLSVVTKS